MYLFNMTTTIMFFIKRNVIKLNSEIYRSFQVGLLYAVTVIKWKTYTVKKNFCLSHFNFYSSVYTGQNIKQTFVRSEIVLVIIFF